VKALIVFYSFSGNTKNIALGIKDILIKKEIDAEILELKPDIESKNFIRQAVQSLFSKKVKLSNQDILDVSEYDYIFLGTPVWAFAPSPALRSFIERCSTLKKKKAYLFATYGSGVGKERCMDKLERLLSKRFNSVIGKIMISDKKIDDKEGLSKVFNDNIKL